MKIHLCFVVCLPLLAFMTTAHSAPVVIAVQKGSAPIDFGVRHLEKSLFSSGQKTERRTPDSARRPNVLVVANEKSAEIKAEGYRILNKKGAITLQATDASGAMYGLLDLAEQVKMRGSLVKIEEKLSNPRLPFRAIKFNLPYMSYRKGESLQLHAETCRDLKFWAQFLDMMAENRFNALTLWNLHPFTLMIRPKNFPEASPFNDAALADWQKFWRTLFRMAKERGIETYMVNWNTFVSPEFAKAHNVATYSESWDFTGPGDTSELVRRYTRECVTQVINEYDDLTGLGVTLGERMGGMTPQEREDWLIETFGAGMKAAKRPIKFIHRAPLSADLGFAGSVSKNTSLLTRAGIAQLGLKSPALVEVKFNWSHAYSSPKLFITHGGALTDDYWNPLPTNYKMTWMMRNEDFFLLRWGDPKFVREHIALNGQSYVNGYYIGSECYIPAKNYLDKPDLAGRAAYAFQRQWLLYMLWGRSLYDPATPDAVFENAFDQRYGPGIGRIMLAAYSLSSRMPLRLATFRKSTWDFTLYSEGFLSPYGGGGKDGFLTINDIIKSAPLDPIYVSIPEYVKATQENRPFEASRITPPILSAKLEEDGRAALKLIDSLPETSPALSQEVADVRAWSS